MKLISLARTTVFLKDFAWAQETGRSFSVPLSQGEGHYTQDLMITPCVT